MERTEEVQKKQYKSCFEKAGIYGLLTATASIPPFSAEGVMLRETETI